MDLTEFLSPKNVILVHGEKPQMAFLKERIESELGMPCYYPGNNESVSIPTTQNLKMSATERFITGCAVEQGKRSLHKRNLIYGTGLSEEIGSDEAAGEGVLLMQKHKSPKILCEDELLEVLGMGRHLVQFEPMVSRIVAAVESELQRAKAADLDNDGK
jgi:integrator complex subunit 11